MRLKESDKEKTSNQMLEVINIGQNSQYITQINM